MKLRSSIIAIAALSSMSFAGGDIGGVTTFENDDYVEAEVQAIEPIVEEIVDTTPIAPATPAKPAAAPVAAAAAPAAAASTGGFYLGGAASLMGTRLDDRVNLFAEEDYQDRQAGITLVAGYDFMDYLGAELRASMALSEENKGNDSMEQYGIYLKPNLPVSDSLDIYGLLGYSMVNMSDRGVFDGDNDGFSFGLGLDYGVTENISVFTDYVNYLRNYGGTNSTWGANLGLKYNF